MRGCASGLETVITSGSTRATSPSVPPRGPMTGPGAGPCARSAPSCDARATGGGYQAGDLLCFADGHRISHVALWSGAGRIVHSALSRGGVTSDDLFADTPTAKRLREYLVAVRRLGG